MNNLTILKQDLATHEARLIEIQDPKFGKMRTRKGGIPMEHYLNVPLLVPSYKNIIKSIKDEIKEIESKKKKK
jgi:hypothetical protein